MIEDIISDLELLFQQDGISGGEFDEFLKNLKSEEVKHYLKSLKTKSKPEQALKNVFFSHGSEFVKLFGKENPEVFRVKTGFIDYVIKREGSRAVDLEIKPPFAAQFQEEKGGRRIFKGIRKEELDPAKYKEQIRKYLKTEGEYLIFTNLETWFFFSKTFSREITKPFAKISFSDFIKQFEQIGDLYKFSNLKEGETVEEDLDERFFKSLDTWVKELKKVEFSVDDKTRDELIINLINKLIFIQCLDNLWVGPYKYLEKTWLRLESEWAGRKKEILNEFLKRTDNYFYKIYDTELFRERDEKTIFDFVKKDEENTELFYKKLKLVLGIDFVAWHIGWVNGIIQFNFRLIDEDILGKAYEKYLAVIRKEEGIYYTPKYITQYIVENTVGKQYDELLNKIKDVLENEDFDKVNELVNKFISLRVLDPACGSGSFLIKALKIIWEKYDKLNDILDGANSKLKSNNSDKTNSNVFAKFEDDARIVELTKKIGLRDKRKLISKIILRHVHGNDLDLRAVEVAKVNIWLEAIKLIPDEFRYDRIPDDTNHILPYLEMNLCHGDSLIGLPKDKTIQFLKENHKEELKKLFELRNQYLQDPTKEKAIEEIKDIKTRLRKDLDKQFKQYLKDNNLPLGIFERTIPFFWSLDFWYVYFNENLDIRNKDLQGFDAVIGNPPYVDSEQMVNKMPINREYHSKIYDSASGNWDEYCVFTERAIQLTKLNGHFSYIIPNKILAAEYAVGIQQILYLHTISNIRDYSRVNVFEEAAVYPIVLTLEKSNRNKNNTIHVEIFDQDRTNIFKIHENRIEQSLLEKLPDGIWSPILSVNFDILEKILKNSVSLEEFGFDIHGACSVSEAYEIGKLINEYANVEKNSEIIKFVNTGTIDRFIPLWGVIKTNYIKNRFDKPILLTKEMKEFSDRRFHESKSKKIIIAGMTKQLECFYDDGEFNAGKSTVIILEKEEYLKLFSALTNSGVISFVYRIFYESLSLSGGYLRVGPPQIRRLPFPLKINDQEKNSIEMNVNKIMTLKGIQQKFKEIWSEYSKKYRNNYKSLSEILMTDKQKIRDGDFDKVWTSDASIYPDGDSEPLNKEFIDFKVITDDKENKIKIYGIFDLSEELVLEIKTKDKELSAIIHLSIQDLLSSRSKVKSLRDIFSKTEVPIIKPNSYENSQNLIKGAAKKFDEWINKQDFDIKVTDIINIENKIQDVDNQINAHVFKLYGLERSEIETILDSLGNIDSVKNNILSKFNDLK